MTDYTLDDLVRDATPDGSDDSGGGDSGSSGDDGGGLEWVGEVFERLDERGFIDAYMSEQLDIDPGEATADVSGDPDDLAADDIAAIGKQVIDHMGDVKISKIVRMAETNPQTVDKLIQAHTGGVEDESQA